MNYHWILNKWFCLETYLFGKEYWIYMVIITIKKRKELDIRGYLLVFSPFVFIRVVQIIDDWSLSTLRKMSMQS